MLLWDWGCLLALATLLTFKVALKERPFTHSNVKPHIYKRLNLLKHIVIMFNTKIPLVDQERRLYGSSWRSGLVTAFLIMGSGFPALAQLPPPGPSDVYPQSYAFSSVTSHIKQYLLTPQGLVSGLLLRNGLQVLLPATLANNIESLAQPGDEVMVYGVPGIQTSFGQTFQAYSITNTNTQRTVAVPSLYPGWLWSAT